MAENYNNYGGSEEGAEENPFGFKRIYYTLIEKLWLILLCLAAGIFLSWGYLKRAPRIYAATAILQVQQQDTRIVSNDGADPGDVIRPDMLKTFERILQSRSLIERVLLTNNLAADARFVPQDGAVYTREQLISAVGSLISVALQPGTRLINISVEHPHPEITEKVANSLVHEFMLQNFELHSTSSEVANQFLRERAEELKLKVQTSENALQAYRKSKGSVSLEKETDIVVQKLRELSTKVANAEAECITLESEMDLANKARGDVRVLLAIPTVSATPTVVDVQNRLNQQDSAIANLKQNYKPKHPKYIEAEAQRIELQNSLSNEVLKAAQTLRSRYDTAKVTEAELKKLLGEQNDLVIELSEQSIRYNELQRELQSNKDSYESIVRKLNETTISKEWEDNKVRVVQRAFVPEKPIKPDKQGILLVGLMAGLGVGLLLALLLEALDTSLKTPDETEATLKQPILSAIPQMRSVQTGKKQLIMATDPESYGAEAFRTLRTTLSMLGPEETRRTFLFTSALPEEGKTFCAINFACSLAQQGSRTLLIECDLRCPRVERALGLGNPGKRHGVSDYLIKPGNLPDLVHSTDVPNFSYLPAGTRAPNPSELLAQESFGKLLEEALVHFDRVVIDSAPIQPVSDTLLIVNRMQTVCLVVRANKTPRRAVQRALFMLLKAKAPLAGVIFNRLAQTRGERYYDYSAYPDYVKTSLARS